MENRRGPIIGAALVLTLFVAAILWARFLHPPRETPAPSGNTFYYTGPMHQKGNPNMWGNEDGSRAAPPPDFHPSAPPRPAGGADSART